MDLFLIYSLIKRLTTPFKDWDAFKLGIIDDKGNIQKSRSELRTQKERAAFGRFDLMILKLKKLLGSFPGGKTRIASYAAALWLIKEETTYTENDLTEEEILEGFNEYYNLLSEDVNVQFEEMLNEDGMAVGAGQVAGVNPGDEPVVTKKARKKFKDMNARCQK